jgi:hypothetical protein
MKRVEPSGDRADQRHADDLALLVQAVLESPGVTDPATRAAAYQGAALPAPFGRYATRVQSDSQRITDGDIQALLAGGSSEDAVFEITVAAALGAALARLEAGLRPLREAD